MLFVDGQQLLDPGLAVPAEPRTAESATQALVRAIRRMLAASRGGVRDLVGRPESVRLRLITSGQPLGPAIEGVLDAAAT